MGWGRRSGRYVLTDLTEQRNDVCVRACVGYGSRRFSNFRVFGGD